MVYSFVGLEGNLKVEMGVRWKDFFLLDQQNLNDTKELTIVAPML